MSVQQVGDVWAGRVEVRDIAGDLADPGAITATVTGPDGAVASLGVARESVGVFTATWPLQQPGRHVVRWLATGAHASAHTEVVDVADPSRPPLVSLDEVRRHLGLGTPATAAQRRRDADLESLADAMTELVEDYCGRRFRPATIEQVWAGGGSAILLDTLPVASVVSVVDGGVTLAAPAYRLSAAAGVLYRRAGGWGETTVTYVAGTSVPPEPVRLAVLRLIEHHWQQARQAPHPLGGSAGGYDEGQPAGERWAIPYAIAALIDGYRVPGIA